jgi:hypothetical protein
MVYEANVSKLVKIVFKLSKILENGSFSRIFDNYTEGSFINVKKKWLN